MDMKQWVANSIAMKKKKAIPVLSFPSTSLMGITVKELISDSSLQARGMKAIAERCDTMATVSMMDLSVEAEAFGATIITDDHEVPSVLGSIINSTEDADKLQIPAVGTARTGVYIDTIKKACELIDDRPVFAGAIGPFSLAGRLMDMTQIILNCYDDPDMVHVTLKKTSQFLINYIDAYKQVGASGVVIAEPAAGLLTPDLIDEFSTPYINEIVRATQTDQFAVIYHNCGNVARLLDSINKIEAYGYHFGNMIDISEVLPKLPADKPVMGNIDPASQFRNGTPESVYQATKELLAKCSKYDNFIISSGCDIPPQSPWENIDAFFNAVADFYG